MMTFRSYCTLFAGILLLAVGSCAQKEQVFVPEGHITMTFSTEDPATKVVTPGTGDANDGGKIVVDANGKPDLIIAVVNSSNTIIAWYPENFGAVPGGTTYTATESTLTASSPVDETTITISGPGRGSYTVYAVANSSGQTTLRTSIASQTTLAGLEAVTISAAGEPSFTPMLLSAKGSLSVNASGSGQVYLPLLRVVGKVSYSFRNETGDELQLYACSVTLKDMNPSQGYLFTREIDFVTGVDRDLVITEDSPDPIDNNSTLTLSPKFVFPSTAPAQLIGNRYLCDITFRTLKGEGPYNDADPSTYDSHSYTDVPIHDSRSADIKAVERNKRLNIVSRISKRAEEYVASFNFELLPWVEVSQSIEFN